MSTIDIGKYKRSHQGGNDPKDIIDSRLEEHSPDVLSFPDDIGVHQFMMTFHEYNFDMEQSNIKKSIVLPIPAAIVDKYGMEYNQKDLGTIGAGATSAINKVGENLTLGGIDAAGADKLGGFDPEEIQQASIQGTSAFTAIARDLNPFKDQVEGVLGQALGNIVNPHTALLFSSIKLKEFEFSWKLYPQSEEESNNLHEILRHIKMYSHPDFSNNDSQTAANNFFLKYPHEVDMYYLGGSQLHRFKRAAVTALSINYTPEGGPAFIGGSGAPAFIELSMGFTETQIWTADDWKQKKESTGNVEKPTDAELGLSNNLMGTD